MSSFTYSFWQDQTLIPFCVSCEVKQCWWKPHLWPLGYRSRTATSDRWPSAASSARCWRWVFFPSPFLRSEKTMLNGHRFKNGCFEHFGSSLNSWSISCGCLILWCWDKKKLEDNGHRDFGTDMSLQEMETKMLQAGCSERCCFMTYMTVWICNMYLYLYTSIMCIHMLEYLICNSCNICTHNRTHLHSTQTYQARVKLFGESSNLWGDAWFLSSPATASRI